MSNANATKIAMVTGAGSGIGRASALAILAEGYAVVLTGRRREPLEETAALAGRAAERAVVVPADVGVEESVNRCLKPPAPRSAGSTCCLTTPAPAPAIPLEDLTVSQWQRVVDVNLTGPFLSHARRSG